MERCWKLLCTKSCNVIKQEVVVTIEDDSVPEVITGKGAKHATPAPCALRMKRAQAVTGVACGARSLRGLCIDDDPGEEHQKFIFIASDQDPNCPKSPNVVPPLF